MVETATPAARSSASLLALADQCVQCGLCLPHCPTYRLDRTEAESPRGRIAYMKALAGAQLAPTRTGDLHLDHCLGCRRCESVCPAGVEYGALLAGSRARQLERTSPGLARSLQLRLLASPRLLALLLAVYRGVFGLLPKALRSLPRPPAATPGAATAVNADMAIFIGCVAGAYESKARVDLVELLSALGISAAMPRAQTCCGTAAIHAGDVRGANALAATNRTAFIGYSNVLSLASGCQEVLEASLQGVTRAQDALAFLDEHGGMLKFRSAQGRRVALHLPCTQRSVTRTDAALRRMLGRVPDLILVELPDTGCCGAAGTHMLDQPDRAAALREPLLQFLANSGAEECLSANIGCRLHLANAAALPIRHPVELLAEFLA